MPPIVDPRLCNRCGTCHDVCPQDVFRFDGSDPPAVAYPLECWYCGSCVLDCPQGAVRLKLPLPMHIVPSPALYGPPAEYDPEELRRAAAFSRSVIEPPPGGVS